MRRSTAEPDRKPKATLEPGAMVEGFRLERAVSERPGLYTLAAATAKNGERVTLKMLEQRVVEHGQRRRMDKLGSSRASIKHPNMVPLVRVSRAGDVVVLGALPDGAVTLEERLGDGEMDPGEAVRILSQVAGALETARKRGLAHRELSPATIILTAGNPPDVLLTDFGVTVPDTRACERVGAVDDADYRAPEEIVGEPSDGRSNVYSLACILVECLTGTAPYPYDRPLLAHHAHLVEPPPKVTDRRASLPPALDDVVAKAMAKAPADRHDTPEAFMTAVQAAVGVEAPIPIPVPAKRPARAKQPAVPAKGPAPAVPAKAPTPAAAGAKTAARVSTGAAPATAGAAAHAAALPELERVTTAKPKRATARKLKRAAAPKPQLVRDEQPAPARRRQKPAPAPPARRPAAKQKVNRRRQRQEARRQHRREKRRERQAAATRSERRARRLSRVVPTWTAVFLVVSAAAGFATGNVGGGNEGETPATRTSEPIASSTASVPAKPLVAPAIERLDDRRTAARRRLSAAKRPGAQAAIATELANAYRAARNSIARAPRRIAFGDDLRKRLAQAESAYRELARAARSGKPAAWQAASREALARERDLELLLRVNRWI